MIKLKIILERNGLYYSLEDLKEAKREGFLELVAKASGDSYGVPTRVKFGKDYDELMRILDANNMEVDEEVWFD